MQQLVQQLAQQQLVQQLTQQQVQQTLIEVLDDVRYVRDDEGEDSGAAAEDEDVDHSLHVVGGDNVTVAHGAGGGREGG